MHFKPRTTPHILLMGVKTNGNMSVSSRTLCLSHFRGCKWGYLVFEQKETGAKRVAMAMALRKNHFFHISSGAGHGTLGLIIFRIQTVWAV